MDLFLATYLLTAFPISSTVGNMSNLRTIYLFDNNYLEIGKNLLTGPVPSSLGNLTKLHTLIIQNNSISGIIPPGIGESQFLRNRQISSNGFHPI